MGNIFTSAKPATPTIVFIEGNIGVGKSTVLQRLEQQGHIVVHEDVRNWKFLKPRYANPGRWMFTCQTEIAMSLFDCINEAILKATISDAKYIFMERSLLACELFSEVSYKNSLINQEELDLLRHICATLTHTFVELETKTVVLDCPIELCMDRIKKRNREGENVDQKYLTELESCYVGQIRDKTDAISIDASDNVVEICNKISTAIINNQ